MNNGFTFHLSLGLPLAVYFVEYIVVTLCSFNLPVFILFLADFFGFFSYMYVEVAEPDPTRQTRPTRPDPNPTRSDFLRKSN
jgi:hypothetical protein